MAKQMQSSMLDKIVRYPSGQAGPYTDGNNIIHFNIPGGLPYDLSQSYVELLCAINVTPGNAGPQDAIYNTEVTYNGTEMPIYNPALVYNATTKDSNGNVIDELQRVDVYSNNMLHYEASRDAKVSMQYKSIYQIYDNDGKLNIFRNFNVNNTLPSQNVTARIPIPLRWLSGLGTLSDFMMQDDMDLQLELNTSRIGARVISDAYAECNDITTDTNNIVISENFGVRVTGFVVGDQLIIRGTRAAADYSIVKQITAINNVGGVVTITVNGDPMEGDANDITDIKIQKSVTGNLIPENTGATNTITVAVEETYDDSPYWNQQLIRIFGLGENIGPIDIWRTIDSVQFSAQTNLLTITFSGAPAFATAPTQTFQIYICNASRGSFASTQAIPSFQFIGADIVLTQKAQAPQFDSYFYNSAVLQSMSGANQIVYDTSIILPPNCFNIFTFFEEPETYGPYSVKDVLTSYRLSLDNKQLTDRDVSFDSPLYYNELYRSFVNATPLRTGQDGKALARYLLKIPNANQPNVILASQNGFRSVSINTPIPMLTDSMGAPIGTQNKLLDMHLQCSAAGIGTVHVYKMIRREL